MSVRATCLGLLFLTVVAVAGPTAKARTKRPAAEGPTWSVRAPSREKVIPVDNEICFLTTSTKPRAVACGKVVAWDTDVKVFHVQVIAGKLMGDHRYTIIARSNLKNRNPASVNNDVYEVIPNERRLYVNVNTGLIAGTNYYFPTLDAMYGFPKHFAVGLGAAYAAGETTSLASSNLTVLLVGDYYFGSAMFDGFFAEAGIGFYKFSASNGVDSESATTYAGRVGGGYQWRPWDSRFDIRLTLGVQILGNPTLSFARTDLNGVLPFAQASIGFSL